VMELDLREPLLKRKVKLSVYKFIKKKKKGNEFIKLSILSQID
jgi:hypothetical protein